MGKYDSIIKYYDAIKSGDFGEIITPERKDDKAFVIPYPKYSCAVDGLINAISSFVMDNPRMDLTNYQSIIETYMKKNRLKRIDEINIETIDDKIAMALLVNAVRSERFCDGYIWELVNAGTITDLLERLIKLNKNKFIKVTW